ncbi:MAG: hypothetical protein JNL30_05245 [Rubrivivax sp.]|nr:hypothetical protein [Rubrivivax sp.]
MPPARPTPPQPDGGPAGPQGAAGPQGSTPAPDGPHVCVVELNRHAPRPFVFTEIALSLRDMLRAAGHHAEHLVNEIDPDAINILFVPTDGWEQALARLDPARTVLFNMEQLGSDSPWARAGYIGMLARWTVADYSSANVAFLRTANGPAQRVHEIPVVPGGSVGFAGEAGITPCVDVLFYGTTNARRERVFKALRAAGLTLEVVSGAYGSELTPALQRARLVLHVHYYDTRLFPVARMLQPLASAVPIVCETSVCPALSDWGRSGIVFADYERLADACASLLHDPARQLEGVRRSLVHLRRVDTASPLNVLLANFAQAGGTGAATR